MSVKKIDCHQHFLKPDQVSYCWMKPDMPLAKDFLPSDLKPWLDKHGVQKTILVEAADSEEENEFMFQLAADNDFIGGIVIWLDMESPGLETDGFESLHKAHPENFWTATLHVWQRLACLSPGGDL